MTEKNLKQLSVLLNEYYQEKAQTCRYDCYNCELGIIEGYGYGHSCAIETVERNIGYELQHF